MDTAPSLCYSILMWVPSSLSELPPAGFVPPLRMTSLHYSELYLLLSECGDPSQLRPGQVMSWPTRHYVIADYVVAYCKSIGSHVRYIKRDFGKSFEFKCLGRWS